MFQNINMLAVLVSSVLSLVLGFIWYGPLFGKKYMALYGMQNMSPEEVEMRKKGATKLYVIQLLLALFEVFVLAHFITGFGAVTGIIGSAWIWAGFVMPTVAAACMWTTDSGKVSWSKFLIQGGYQLLIFIVFGAILGAWY